ncbi:MAG: helix-turn-helix domain-containing protein [Acidobacteriia bacterium]|nr:helix-turn-helix domain-containing protein [Terriglobia bacterium]
MGSALREIRRRKNLSQAELGVVLNWPRNIIAQYESGAARPSSERLISLLRLAATDDERGPILEALKAHGVLASDLAPALATCPDDSPAAASMDSVSPDPVQASMSGNGVFADKGLS